VGGKRGSYGDRVEKGTVNLVICFPVRIVTPNILP
jgi:hypothetical protein